MKRLLPLLLERTGLGWLPVRIRHGHLRGARWTLWPHSAYWRGHYEPDVQSALARHAPPPGAAVWDLGAHFGFYSLWLARSVGPDGQIVSVEPDSTSAERLRRHVQLNPWAPVRIFGCAASDANGTVNLIQSQGAGATTSHLAYQGEVPVMANTLAVETVRLDDLMARENLSAPTLIKIDVEGHAGAALRGAAATLARHRPRLLISLHSPEECAGVREQLAPLGYAPSSLDDQPMAWADTLFHTAWFSCPSPPPTSPPATPTR